MIRQILSAIVEIAALGLFLGAIFVWAM